MKPTYDPQKNGWNRDWETDNVPDNEDEAKFDRQRVEELNTGELGQPDEGECGVLTDGEVRKQTACQFLRDLGIFGGGEVN